MVDFCDSINGCSNKAVFNGLICDDANVCINAD